MSDTPTPEAPETTTHGADAVILDRPGGTLTSSGDSIVENDLTDAEFEAATADLSDVALRLSAKRKAVAAQIETAIVDELADLGMPGSRFEVRIEQPEDPAGWIQDDNVSRTAFSDGMDRCVFFISTNPGVEPMPLARVASGGEISRIMLALKSILAKSDRLPILIFDEIDAEGKGCL